MPEQTKNQRSYFRIFTVSDEHEVERDIPHGEISIDIGQRSKINESRPKTKDQLTGGGRSDEEQEEKEGAGHGRPIDERRMRMNELFNLEESRK